MKKKQILSITLYLLSQLFLISCVPVQKTEVGPIDELKSHEDLEPPMAVSIIPTENQPSSLDIENQVWRLFLFLDPYAPPFKSHLIEVNFDLVDITTPMAHTVITTDDEFLGRENYLSWNPYFSKAIFANQDGVFLFNPKDNTFSMLHSELPLAQEFYWNEDGLSIAYMTQNENVYSGDILLVDVETASVKRFGFQKDKLPRLIGWISKDELLMSIDEMGYEDCLKGCITGRKLYLLNINTGLLTDFLVEEDWLHTESLQLSPSAKWLLYRKVQHIDMGNLLVKTMRINLQNWQVDELNIDSGLFKWIDDNSFVVYTIYEENANITWYENWSAIQIINTPDTLEISEVIPTPDKNSLVVFFTLSSVYRGSDLPPVGYKAYILKRDGSKSEFSLQGYDSCEWKVRYATFLPSQK